MQVAGTATPDTILCWYRRLIAKKYDDSAVRRRGRPMTRNEITALMVRMAVENPQWGYTRIREALSNLGHNIARTTVKRILHDHTGGVYAGTCGLPAREPENVNVRRRERRQRRK